MYAETGIVIALAMLLLDWLYGRERLLVGLGRG